MKINIRLNSTDGSELFPDDYVLTLNTEVPAKSIEDFIETFKDENEDYQVHEVADAIEEHFNGSIECVTFAPDIDVIV